MKTHSYPAWFYGPNGASDIFDSDAEVPAGWVDHPSKVGEKPAATPKPLEPAPAASKPLDTVPAGDLDAEGWPFDPEQHAATKSRTKAGLWRMKVGVSRPEPKPGFPKPVLDL